MFSDNDRLEQQNGLLVPDWVLVCLVPVGLGFRWCCSYFSAWPSVAMARFGTVLIGCG